MTQPAKSTFETTEVTGGQARFADTAVVSADAGQMAVVRRRRQPGGLGRAVVAATQRSGVSWTCGEKGRRALPTCPRLSDRSSSPSPLQEPSASALNAALQLRMRANWLLWPHNESGGC